MESTQSGISRRSFLKTTVAAAGATALTGSAGTALAEYQMGQKAGDGEQLFHVVCHPNCFGYCRLNAHVRDGKLTKISPVLWDGELEDFRRICLRGLSHVQRVYDSERVLYPLKRKSWAAGDYHVDLRGKEDFERISWDDAVKLITDEWKKKISEYGTGSLVYWPAFGNPGNLNGVTAGFPARLQAMVGMTKMVGAVDLASTIGLNMAVGAGDAQPWPGNEPTDYMNSKALILWGNNVTDAQIQEWHFIYDAKKAGVKLICIDPIFTVTASKADWWIPIRPATDGVLYHAIAQVEFAEDLIDRDFLTNHTVAPFLVRRDTGKFLRMSDIAAAPAAEAIEDAEADATATATEVAAPGVDYAVIDPTTGAAALVGTVVAPELFGSFTVNGIQVDTALTLYKKMVDEFPPEKASVITGISADDIVKLAHICADGPVNHRLGWGPQAFNNGVHTIFAGISMCALTGNFGKPGAGFGANWDMNTAGINFVDNYMHGTPLGAGASFSSLQVREVCRSGKLNGEPFVLKNLLFVCGNPICCCVNTNELLEDVLPVMDMVVTIDHDMTDTARNSDFVLPACHWFETSDIMQCGQAHMVEYSEKALEPLGESKSDADICRLLGEAMGIGHIFAQTDEERIMAAIDTDWNRMMGITGETLKEKKSLRYLP